MHKILEHLEADHNRIIKLLYLIDKEIAKLAGTRQGKANIEKILDILDYLRVYPNDWHHPTEKILMDYFISDFHPGASADIQSHQARARLLSKEHKQLDALSEQLAECFNEVHQSIEECAGYFQKIFRQFQRSQMRHINAERAVFALIDACLTEVDWDAIETRVRSALPKHALDEMFFYSKHAETLGLADLITSSDRAMTTASGNSARPH